MVPRPVIGNRGNRGPRPWNMRPWCALEWRGLRDAWAATPPATSEAAFWQAVASAMATNRSPDAVARRAANRGMQARICDSMNPRG